MQEFMDSKRFTTLIRQSKLKKYKFKYVSWEMSRVDVSQPQQFDRTKDLFLDTSLEFVK
jgi:hypothetical protein